MMYCMIKWNACHVDAYGANEPLTENVTYNANAMNVNDP